MTLNLAKVRTQRCPLRNFAAFGCYLFLCSIGSLCAAEPVRDEKLKISFVPPEGFVPAPDELRQPIFSHNFVRDLDSPGKTFFIRIRGADGNRLPGRLSDEDLESLRQTQPGAERFTEEWKSFKMDGIKAVVTDGQGVQWVSYDIPVPVSTQPQAVAILVSGPAPRDAEVREVLRDLLRTVEGTLDPRATADGKLKPNGFVLTNKHLLLTGILLTAAVSVGWRLLRRKHRSPPATSG